MQWLAIVGNNLICTFCISQVWHFAWDWQYFFKLLKKKKKNTFYKILINGWNLRSSCTFVHIWSTKHHQDSHVVRKWWTWLLIHDQLHRFPCFFLHLELDSFPYPCPILSGLSGCVSLSHRSYLIWLCVLYCSCTNVCSKTTHWDPFAGCKLCIINPCILYISVSLFISSW